MKYKFRYLKTFENFRHEGAVEHPRITKSIDENDPDNPTMLDRIKSYLQTLPGTITPEEYLQTNQSSENSDSSITESKEEKDKEFREMNTKERIEQKSEIDAIKKQLEKVPKQHRKNNWHRLNYEVDKVRVDRRPT